MFCHPRHNMPVRDLHFTISRPTKRQLLLNGEKRGPKAGGKREKRREKKGKKSWQKVGKIFAGFRKILYLCNAFKRRP